MLPHDVREVVQADPMALTWKRMFAKSILIVAGTIR
jgi:hypothetical protein